MASTTETKPKGDGASLFKALLARVREAKIGEVVEHKDGQYARVLIEDGKRNAGYVVPGKTKLNVYPQALAKQMPEGVGFKKVKLGAHHYGRGEVIVPVDREDDFDTALKALQAAAKLPAPQRKGAKKDEAASNGNGQPKAKASGPAKAGGQKASGPKARAAAKAPAGK